MFSKKKLFILLIIITSCGATLGGQTRLNDTDFMIFTVENESDGGFQWLETRLNEFSQEYFTRTGRRLRISLMNYQIENMREPFMEQNSPRLPDLFLTVNDHIGPLVQARKLLPLSSLPGFDGTVYRPETLPAARLPGRSELWGAPFSYGNQLMLYYNKKLVPTPPRNTNELVSMSKAQTLNGRYGLVFWQTEPFWLVPWLGGFGGQVFKEDGVTPNLDSPAMVGALSLLRKWKLEDRILPVYSDYATSNDLFIHGKAAMIINGDWYLNDYINQFGDDLGVAPLPIVSSTGKWPLPYTSGKYFLATIKNQGNTQRLTTLSQLVQYFSRQDTQISMVRELLRLPVTRQATQVVTLVDDPLLNRLLHEVQETQIHTTPMPTVVEMGANWDAMRPLLNQVLNGRISPEMAAGDMQDMAEESSNFTRGD